MQQLMQYNSKYTKDISHHILCVVTHCMHQWFSKCASK